MVKRLKSLLLISVYLDPVCTSSSYYGEIWLCLVLLDSMTPWLSIMLLCCIVKSRELSRVLSFTVLMLYGALDCSGEVSEEICFEPVVAAACVIGGFNVSVLSQVCDLLCES